VRTVLLILISIVSIIACSNKKEMKGNDVVTVNDGIPLQVTGTLIMHESIPSKFVASRNVTVWLPDGYANNLEKKYPVIYFMDGQNMFDPKTSYIGVDWAADEWADKLIKSNQIREVILVGIWNTEKRVSEYFPQKASDFFEESITESIKRKFSEYEPLGDDYLKYLVFEVKPFIDSNYRTESDQLNTMIGGSSMGGLISLYALSEYPQIFGTALCVSTHWPIGNGVVLNYFKKNLPKAGDHRIYFDYGTETLDKEYEPYQMIMDKIMSEKGYEVGQDWITIRFPGDDHSERSWRKRLGEVLQFALVKTN